MKIKTVFFLALLGYLLPVSPVAADFTITYVQPGSSKTNTIYIRNGKVRISSRKGKKEARQYMIYDSKRKVMTSVDHKRHKYVVMTEKDIDRLMKRMPTAEDVATRGIQNRVPWSKIRGASWIPGRTKRAITEKPARRGAKKIVKGVEKTAPKVLPHEKRRVVKTKRRQTIKGVRCTNHKVYRGKKKLGVLCVASRSAVKMTRSDYKALKAYHRYGIKMTAFSKKAAGPFAYRIDDFIMTNVNGVVIQSKASRRSKSLKMTRVSRKRLPGSLFKIPKGYKKQKM